MLAPQGLGNGYSCTWAEALSAYLSIYIHRGAATTASQKLNFAAAFAEVRAEPADRRRVIKRDAHDRLYRARLR